MTFSEALVCLKHGLLITREGWNGKNMFLFLFCNDPDLVKIGGEGPFKTVFPVAHDIIRRDYIMMYTAQKDLVPWVASQSDILADDWSEFCQQVEE